MDISPYISRLLFDNDCVIIPGFGGFITAYRPAQLDQAGRKISPPSKSLSFNRSLTNNDGLLIHEIATKEGFSFDHASGAVSGWVESAKSLLRNREELVLQKIGSLSYDREGNLQFTPDGSVNYLKSAFGLPVVEAIPVEKAIVVPLQHPHRRRRMRIAAAILLAACLATLIPMIKINPLRIDEAGISQLIERIFEKKQEAIAQKQEEKINSSPETVVVEPEVTVSEPGINETATPNVVTPSTELTTSTGYYIIIGAFVEEKNIEAARTKLSTRFPDSAILVEKGSRLTRVGYLVGSDESLAREKLAEAQQDDAGVWMMKK